jgi:hypothetical protein
LSATGNGYVPQKGKSVLQINQTVFDSNSSDCGTETALPPPF